MQSQLNTKVDLAGKKWRLFLLPPPPPLSLQWPRTASHTHFFEETGSTTLLQPLLSLSLLLLQLQLEPIRARTRWSSTPAAASQCPSKRGRLQSSTQLRNVNVNVGGIRGETERCNTKKDRQKRNRDGIQICACFFPYVRCPLRRLGVFLPLKKNVLNVFLNGRGERGEGCPFPSILI